jgi:hypothetical protein
MKEPLCTQSVDFVYLKRGLALHGNEPPPDTSSAGIYFSESQSCEAEKKGSRGFYFLVLLCNIIYVYIYICIYIIIYIDCPIARCTPDLNSWNIFYLKTVFPTIYFTMEYSFPFRLHSLWSGNGRRSRPTKRTGSHSLGWFWVCFQGFFSPSIKSGWVCSLEDPLQFN